MHNYLVCVLTPGDHLDSFFYFDDPLDVLRLLSDYDPVFAAAYGLLKDDNDVESEE